MTHGVELSVFGPPSAGGKEVRQQVTRPIVDGLLPVSTALQRRSAWQDRFKNGPGIPILTQSMGPGNRARPPLPQTGSVRPRYCSVAGLLAARLFAASRKRRSGLRFLLARCNRYSAALLKGGVTSIRLI